MEPEGSLPVSQEPPLGIPRRGWVDNMKMELKETRWDSMDWIDIAHKDGLQKKMWTLSDLTRKLICSIRAALKTMKW
jgi:hypothetical protein